MAKADDYFTMKPEIRIDPYCVFCKKYTENVQKYVYGFPYLIYNRFDSVLIEFPSHRICFIWQRIKYLLAFPLSAAIFFFLSYLFSRYLFVSRSIFALPKWLLSLLCLFSLVISIIIGFKNFFSMEEKIHTYYVLHEKIGEADKSWRVRAKRRSQAKENQWK